MTNFRNLPKICVDVCKKKIKDKKISEKEKFYFLCVRLMIYPFKAVFSIFEGIEAQRRRFSFMIFSNFFTLFFAYFGNSLCIKMGYWQWFSSWKNLQSLETDVSWIIFQKRCSKGWLRSLSIGKKTLLWREEKLHWSLTENQLVNIYSLGL